MIILVDFNQLNNTNTMDVLEVVICMELQINTIARILSASKTMSCHFTFIRSAMIDFQVLSLSRCA